MRCTSCQYPLWRLRARQCPECGTPFTPGEFDFVPYSVKFLCPHCEQEYYGDGPRGHLNPREFDCVKCARRVRMDEMVVEPAAGVQEAQTQTRKVPWLERRSLGGFRAWYRTLGMSLAAPGELMHALPRDARTGTAVWFMVVTQAIIWLVAAVPIWALIGSQMLTAATGRGGTAIGPMAGVLLAMYAVGFVILLGLWLVFGLAAHAVLMVTGRRQAGLGRTMQAFAYSSGANVLTAIPCLGGYVGWIWWVVSATLMVKEGQRVSGWRAALAVVAPVVVSLTLFIGGYAYFIYWAISAGQAAIGAAAGAAVSMTELASVQKVRAGLTTYAAANGDWPAHGALLIHNGHATGADFVGGPNGWSATLPAHASVGAVTLAEFEAQASDDRASAADSAAASLPSGTPAHRLGDLVICVSPGDPVNLPGGVWMVLVWPRTDVPGATRPPVIAAAQADGEVVPILSTDFAVRLEEQNALRAANGLPPLPHPADVK